jgi:hypothetical protein
MCKMFLTEINNLIAGVVDTGDKFIVVTCEQLIAGVIDTGEKHSFANIFAKFRKIIRNGPNGILSGPGGY